MILDIMFSRATEVSVQEQYWIRQGATVQGPFPLSRVLRWISEGRVRPEMGVSTDGGETWRAGGDCPELFTPHPPPLPDRSVRRAPLASPTRARTRAARTPVPEPKRGKWKWILIAVAVLWVVGTITQKQREQESAPTTGALAPSVEMSHATYRGQRMAVLDHNFTYKQFPSGVAEYPLLGVDSSAVGYMNNLSALVRKAKRTAFVLERQGAYVCFQWNAKFKADEFGRDRGHGPSFWIILSTDTIRKIEDTFAIDDDEWIGHFVESGRGRWGS